MCENRDLQIGVRVQDFSNLVLTDWIITFHTNPVPIIRRSKDSGNITRLKFESRTRIPI